METECRCSGNHEACHRAPSRDSTLHARSAFPRGHGNVAQRVPRRRACREGPDAAARCPAAIASGDRPPLRFFRYAAYEESAAPVWDCAGFRAAPRPPGKGWRRALPRNIIFMGRAGSEFRGGRAPRLPVSAPSPTPAWDNAQFRYQGMPLARAPNAAREARALPGFSATASQQSHVRCRLLPDSFWFLALKHAQLS